MQTDSPTQGVRFNATVDADAKPNTSSAPFLAYTRAEPETEPAKPIVGSLHIFAVSEPCASPYTK
jgi:hypothetical protein